MGSQIDHGNGTVLGILSHFNTRQEGSRVDYFINCKPLYFWIVFILSYCHENTLCILCLRLNCLPKEHNPAYKIAVGENKKQ